MERSGNEQVSDAPQLAGAAETAEPLHQLRWAWEEPLELIQGGPHPRERWLLKQGRRPVVAIDRLGAGWALEAAAEGWTAAVRRRRRRLGWHLELASVGELDPVLYYCPHTLLAGGSLGGAGDGRYKLRAPFLRADWTLEAVRGRELAHILLWAKLPNESARVRTLRAGLVPGASVEPNLLLLLAAASVAIIIHHQQPQCCAGGSI
jgi:hypothetical protein